MGQSELQSLLEAMTDHVYFQPPANLQIEYPCIVYKRDDIETIFAGNRPYYQMTRFMVTSISRDPNNDVYKQIAALSLSTFLRNFVIDNLHHDVFLLYA